MNNQLIARKKANPVLIMVILVLAAVAAPMNLYKVAPIAPDLMKLFGIKASQIGMLVSVFSLAGIVLALPSGMLVRKFGAWKCVLYSLLALLLGSVVGSLSNSFALLLLSRVIEGIGMTMIAVAGPSIIGETIDRKKRGIAMGIFSAYMGVGQVLTYNLAPRILSGGGWQQVWWLSSAYTALVTCVWVVLMLKLGAFAKGGAAEQSATEQQAAGTGEERGALRAVLKDKGILFLSLAIAMYTISYNSIQTFLPTYLSSSRGMNLANASSLVSVCCLTGTVFSVLAGIVSDKLNSRRLFGGICMIVSGALFLFIPFTPLRAYLPFLIVLGMVPPVLPVCVFAAASEVIDNPKRVGIAMGIISLGQNIGFVAGPALFGGAVQYMGWSATFFLSVPVAIAGGIFMIANKKVR